MEMDESNRTEAFVSLFAQSQYEIYSFVLTLVPNRANADNVLHPPASCSGGSSINSCPAPASTPGPARLPGLEVQHFRRVKGRDRLVFDNTLLQSLGTCGCRWSDELEAHRWPAARLHPTKLRLDDRELIRRLVTARRRRPPSRWPSKWASRSTPCTRCLSVFRRGLYECVQRAMNAGDRSLHDACRRRI